MYRFACLLTLLSCFGFFSFCAKSNGLSRMEQLVRAPPPPAASNLSDPITLRNALECRLLTYDNRYFFILRSLRMEVINANSTLRKLSMERSDAFPVNKATLEMFGKDENIDTRDASRFEVLSSLVQNCEVLLFALTLLHRMRLV